MLDHLALQELHVVDDQEVDVAQRILQRQRIIVADRGGKAPHEIFGRQIDDAQSPRVLYCRISDRLQQVGLAEADSRMNEERVEAHSALTSFRNRLSSRKCDPVRAAFDEGVEGKTAIERRTEERRAKACWPCGGNSRNRLLDGLTGRLRACRAAHLRGGGWFRRDRLIERLGAVARCRAHQDFDFQNFRILGLEQTGDEIEITIVDPRLQEGRGDRKANDALRYRMQLQSGKPAGIDVRTDLGLQARADALKQNALLHFRLCFAHFEANGSERLRCRIPIVEPARRHRIHLHNAAFQFHRAASAKTAARSIPALAG